MTRSTAVVLISGICLLPVIAQEGGSVPVDSTFFAQAAKEPDAIKRLGVLNSWKQQLPQSQMEQDRLTLFFLSFLQVADSDGMDKAAAAMIANNMIVGAYNVAYLATLAEHPSATLLEYCSAAGTLLKIQLSVNGTKPATASEIEWRQLTMNVATRAYNAAGFSATKQGKYEAAEAAYRASLGWNPLQADVSFRIGSLLAQQGKADRYSEAVYHFLRASAIDGPTALPSGLRDRILQRLEVAFNATQGGSAEFAKLRELAKINPLPPTNLSLTIYGQAQSQPTSERSASQSKAPRARNVRSSWTETLGSALQGFAQGALRAQCQQQSFTIQRMGGNTYSVNQEVRPFCQ